VCVYLWRGFLYLDHAYYWRIFHGFDTRADELIGGCAAAVTISIDQARNRTKVWLINHQNVGLISLIILLISALIDSFGVLYFFVTIPVLIILTATIIFDVTLNENSILSGSSIASILVRIGVISYGIYLWHFPFLDFIRSTALDYGVLRAVLAFGAAPIAAALSFRYFEFPILTLKHRLRERQMRAEESSATR